MKCPRCGTKLTHDANGDAVCASCGWSPKFARLNGRKPDAADSVDLATVAVPVEAPEDVEARHAAKVAEGRKG